MTSERPGCEGWRGRVPGLKWIIAGVKDLAATISLHPRDSAAPCSHELCADEWVCVIGELADAGFATVTFEIPEDCAEVEVARLLSYAGHRNLDTVVRMPARTAPGTQPFLLIDGAGDVYAGTPLSRIGSVHDEPLSAIAVRASCVRRGRALPR